MTRRLVTVLCGLTAGVLVGGWAGLAVGLVTAVVLDRYLARLEPAAKRRERERAALDLPYAADLLAGALRAGLPTERAVEVVAAALDGPVGHRLAAVARSLRLGLAPTDAWRPMYDLPAGVRMSTAVARSADSGAALAGAFVRLADELRTARLAAVEAAGQRSGVLLVLPLGLCFLPAFVLAGIVPVIVAVLGDVLR
jgi:Flp pilus assembly protein TadB